MAFSNIYNRVSEELQATKICPKCKRELLATLDNFHKGTSKDDFSWWCKDCLNSYKKQYYDDNKLRIGWQRIERKYGLAREQYDDMIVEQQGRCKCCGEALSNRVVVDHDHKTGKARGLLCDRCNRLIGTCGESVDVLNKAIEYLRSMNG